MSYLEPANEGFTKVKILRGYQNYEIGSIVDIQNDKIKYLLGRKVVEIFNERHIEEYKKKEEEEGIKAEVLKENQGENRAVGLEDSPPPPKKTVRKKRKVK